MLADKELDEATSRLAEFRAASAQHHETLSGVLEKYSALVDDYKRLKSDYEEERDSRERYKQMAKGQERNPFVLVLIDGDGYIFDDDLISGGVEGGQTAAQLLNDAVKRSLRSLGLEHCRIMLRVYANLAGLSKVLSKVKLAGPEKRSLAPFTASFTRSNDLFDFVDAGELKENADFKIRGMFRQFVENAQCKHIYFAGCHDVGYLSELTPYSGQRDRITLVRTPSFHFEFTKLSLRVEDFANVFRRVPLEGPSSSVPVNSPSARPMEPAIVPINENTAAACPFFQKGTCKYGKTCRNLHVKVSPNGTNTSSNAGGLFELRDWRQNSGAGKSTLSSHMSAVPRYDDEFVGGNKAVTHPAALPSSEDIPRNAVPVNKYQHRLDAYIPTPSPADRAAFQARIAGQKLCNKYQISGNCHNDDCPYDHDPISPGILNSLKQIALSQPCPRKGTCRSLDCLYGHVCQRADCQKRGGNLWCKFSIPAHHMAMEVEEYVPGVGQMDDAESSGAYLVMNSKSSTPPVPEFIEPPSESDPEQDGVEGYGALLDSADDSSVD